MLKKSICPLFVKKGPKNTSPVAFLPHNNQKKKNEPRSFFTTMTIKHAIQKNKLNKTINKDSNPQKIPTWFATASQPLLTPGPYHLSTFGHRRLVSRPRWCVCCNVPRNRDIRSTAFRDSSRPRRP